MKLAAINSIIAIANNALDGADTMRKAELVELLAASIKAVRALPDAPSKVAHFGSSSGEFGWTGIDAVGNRITWKSEPAKVAAVGSAVDAAPTPDTQALMLIELQAVRAELMALRQHADAPVVKLTDTERFAHMPPPAGTKHGRWQPVVGSPTPVWGEREPAVYDPTPGGIISNRGVRI